MRRALTLLALLAGFVILSSQQISLRSSADDLGRHLRDGQIILSGSAPAIFHQNFYSYTYPHSPFLNHHWLMTVLFYGIWKAAGFAGLNAVYIGRGAIAMWLAFRIAEREAGLPVA